MVAVHLRARLAPLLMSSGAAGTGVALARTPEDHFHSEPGTDTPRRAERPPVSLSSGAAGRLERSPVSVFSSIVRRQPDIVSGCLA